MEIIIKSLIDQWPSLTGLICLSLVSWVLFKKYFEENKSLIEGLKVLSSEQRSDLEKLIQKHQEFSIEQRSSIDQVLDRYKNLSNDQVSEINRLQTLVRSLLDENERIGKRYDEIKNEFSKLTFENRALKKAVDNVDEMVRATGGDVKVISTQLRKAQEDIVEMTKWIEYKPRNQ